MFTRKLRIHLGRFGRGGLVGLACVPDNPADRSKLRRAISRAGILREPGGSVKRPIGFITIGSGSIDPCLLRRSLAKHADQSFEFAPG